MAYPNHTINEGGSNFGSYQAANAIAIYLRVKFVSPASIDGKPKIDVALIGDRTEGVAFSPIAAAAWGPIKFSNGGGETYGVCVGTILVGGDVYSAAGGKVSAVTTGGALLIGVATCDGFDGGVITYAINTPIA